MSIAAHHQPQSPAPGDQQRAASDPAVSAWVNASAGSGKTTILTDRVARLLLEGVRPEKILCLTYTRAGAAEMTNRVTRKLSQWAVCGEDELRQDLDRLQNKTPTPRQINEARRLFARVLSCPGGLRMRTIHSFCQEILSRFPLEAGLPPHFALIDELELDILRNEVLDDLLREAAENPGQKLAQALSVLVAAQGEFHFIRTLQEVTRARGRLDEAVREAGGEKNLIDRIRTLLQLDPEDTPESIRRAAMENLPEENVRKMAAWLEKGTPSHQERSQKFYALLALPPTERHAQFKTYRDLFLFKSNEAFYDKYIASKNVRDLHPEIDALSAHESLRLQLTLERIEAAEIAEITASVLSFGAAFAHRLAERKKARAALDYDDLILRAEALLRRPGIAPWILYKLDNGIDHILVDEAQDTSKAQWNIVQALTEEFYAGAGARASQKRTLFVVGDEKQSIFSFQNADPESFLALRGFFAERLAGAGKNLRQVDLRTSFRSAPMILKAIDHIFENADARAGVSPGPIIHEAFKRDKSGRVEIWPLLKPAARETASSNVWAMPTGYEEEHDPQAELAQQIARKIKTWIDRREILPGATRPIAPGDIMILLRHRGSFASLMVRALKAQEVPVTGVDRMHLVKQLPVMDLLAMLRFVLLPEDDLNLASLLRGPLLGASEDQLMELAIGRADSLWHSLKNAPAFRAMHDYLAARLSEADFSTPFAFLSHILNAPCPANRDSGRKALWARLGDEALDPIEELLNEAQSFSQRHSPSLQNFLHWLTQADAEIKRELDQGAGQVRIMTVHASKGLEAPIVFLPDTVAVPQPQALPKLQWSAEGLPIFLARKPDFALTQTLWQKARDRQMEEYRRLFYVALTRAENRLYICGWLGEKSEEAPAESWYGIASSQLRPLHQAFRLTDRDGPTPEIVFADASPAPAAAPEATATSPVKTALPLWARQPIQALSISAALPLGIGEDQPTATPDAAFARGRIIHRLLQSLPDLSVEKRDAMIARFLSHPSHGLTPAGRDEIAREVSNLLNDERFAALWSADSLAEAPLVGQLDGIPVFRQIDRLCQRGNEIWIVDYKTNRPPPLHAKDIPASYRKQLAEYRILLSGIYPGKNVRCFLLWTYAPRLMEVTKEN